MTENNAMMLYGFCQVTEKKFLIESTDHRGIHMCDSYTYIQYMPEKPSHRRSMYVQAQVHTHIDFERSMAAIFPC